MTCIREIEIASSDFFKVPTFPPFPSPLAEMALFEMMTSYTTLKFEVEDLVSGSSFESKGREILSGADRLYHNFLKVEQLETGKKKTLFKVASPLLSPPPQEGPWTEALSREAAQVTLPLARERDGVGLRGGHPGPLEGLHQGGQARAQQGPQGRQAHRRRLRAGRQGMTRRDPMGASFLVIP